MLNNQDLIDGMTEEQKLKLVTGFAALGDDRANAEGMPRVVALRLQDINERSGNPYPPFKALANTWSAKLFSYVSSDLSNRACQQANLIYTSPAYLRSSPYAFGMSEDPYLNKTLARSMCTGIESTGASACLTDLSVRSVDCRFMDKTPDPRAVSELLLRTFSDVISAPGVCSAVAVSHPPVKKRWLDGSGAGVAKTLASKAEGVRVVYMGASQDVAVSSMPRRDALVSDTSVGAIKAALLNYRRIKADVDRGAVSLEELNKAVADGVAISDEMLDIAADKVIDFAKECARRRPLEFLRYESDMSEEDAQAQLEQRIQRAVAANENKLSQTLGNIDIYRRSLEMRTASESIVLLKNNDILPLESKTRVMLVGELASCVPGLLDSAKAAFEAKGIAYAGYAEGYKLDADKSEECADEAVKLCADVDTVILVVGHGKKREAAMSETCMLTLPANQLALVERLAALGKRIVAVVAGNYIPDMKFDERCDASLFAPRSGVCAGAALLNVLTGAFNPCGKLAASAYNDTDAYFKSLSDFKNSGRTKVGVFIGYRHYITSGLRAKYPFGHGLSYSRFELSGLKRTDSGVSVTVKNKSKLQGCEVLQLYVGMPGSKLVRPTRELKGFYKINLKPHEKRTINIALNTDDLAVYDARTGKFKTEGGKYTLYVGFSCTDIRCCVETTVAGETLQESGDKLSDYLRNVSNINDGDFMLHGGKDKKQKFVPRVLPEFPYEKLFMDEFGVEIEDDDEDEDIAVTVDDDDDTSKYIGVGVTPKQLYSELSCCLAEQELSTEPGFVRTVISAVASSKLLFVCTDDTEKYSDFVSALGAFMSANPLLIDVSGCTHPAALFLNNDMPTPLAELVSASKQNHSVIQLVSAEGVDPATMHEYFTPFIRYISNPENNRITYGDYGDDERTLTVAPNIWFVMRVSPSAAATVPAHLADISATVLLSNERGSGGISQKRLELNYYKFVNAFESAAKAELDERGWKAIDKLVEYVNNRSGVKIGNKMWIQMEKFLDAYFSVAEGDDAQADALDAIVSAKLVPLFAPLLAGKLTKDDGDFAGTLRDVMGDDGATKSAAMSIKLAITAER